MKRTARRTTIALLFGCLMASAITVMAHHSFASEFDINKPIRIEGKVTQVTWANPHASIEVTVSSNSGGPLVWRVELPEPNDLSRAGLNRNSITVGAAINVGGYSAKSGERLIGAATLTVKTTGLNLAIPVERSTLFDPTGEHFYAGISVQLTGKVISVERVNPVPTVRIAATTAGVQTEDWIVETAPTTTLDQIGWFATSLVPGDVIQVAGNAEMSGLKRVFANKVVVIEKNGKTLTSPLALLNSTPLK